MSTLIHNEPKLYVNHFPHLLYLPGRDLRVISLVTRVHGPGYTIYSVQVVLGRGLRWFGLILQLFRPIKRRHGVPSAKIDLRSEKQPYHPNYDSPRKDYRIPLKLWNKVKHFLHKYT